MGFHRFDNGNVKEGFHMEWHKIEMDLIHVVERKNNTFSTTGGFAIYGWMLCG